MGGDAGAGVGNSRGEVTPTSLPIIFGENHFCELTEIRSYCSYPYR
jgi:hypothetical protein